MILTIEQKPVEQDRPNGWLNDRDRQLQFEQQCATCASVGLPSRSGHHVMVLRQLWLQLLKGGTHKG